MAKIGSIRNGKPLHFVFLGLRPSACWDWDWVWDWVALGWPKRGPRATQASPKGGPSDDLGKRLCLQQKQENGGGGVVLAG
jgi:hypothetical protein